MTSIDFNALTKMAQDAGFDTEELESGVYLAEVKNANYTGPNSRGKSQFGFRFVVTSGPKQGQGVWKNLNVPTPESKPAAAHIFLRDLATLGVDQQLAAVNPDAAAKAVIGRQFEITVKRTRPKTNGGFWTDVDVKPLSAPAAPVQQQIPMTQPPVQGVVPGAPGGPEAATAAWQQRPI